ncbi:MAG: hypothetical protein RJQ09_00490 [Cyclobacteriaceae bacterium]
MKRILYLLVIPIILSVSSCSDSDDKEPEIAEFQVAIADLSSSVFEAEGVAEITVLMDRNYSDCLIQNQLGSGVQFGVLCDAPEDLIITLTPTSEVSNTFQLRLTVFELDSTETDYIVVYRKI